MQAFKGEGEEDTKNAIGPPLFAFCASNTWERGCFNACIAGYLTVIVGHACEAVSLFVEN